MEKQSYQSSFSFDAVIFDLDGVVTKTAVVHAAAWKVMFDEYLHLCQDRDGEDFKEFTYKDDYLTYVDGKPRYKGVASFLESRNIHIPFGQADDGAEAETVCGLGNRKNTKFREVLERDGVNVYFPAVVLIKDLHANNIRVGVASSSKNCQFILQSAKIEELFETRIDGVVSVELGLQGKPHGDIFVTAAANVGASPARAVVVEDAVSGVQAGVNGGFGLVIGVARENNIEELKKHGADVVVEDFNQVTTQTIAKWFRSRHETI